MKRLVTLRRSSQIVFLSLFIYILWSTTYPLKGLLSPRILFKIDPLLIFLTALSERLLIPAILFSLIMILLTLILGRFFCGWVCPLGTFIDLFGSANKDKNNLTKKMNARIRKIKYVILSAIIIFALLGLQTGWFLDPIATMGRVVSLNIIPTITSAIDSGFIFLIKKFGLYGAFYDFYRNLKSSLLGVNIYFFDNSLPTLIFFLTICFASVFISRLWCRMICPLGALYAFFTKKSLLSRYVDKCTNCRSCFKDCRMGAIKEDATYDKGECILCMDCIYDCPQYGTRFSFFKNPIRKEPVISSSKNNISRKNFMFLLFSSFAFAGFRFNFSKKKKVIRPPGVKNEADFLNMCVRCGNCMKVCITNGLQPTLLESGPQGIWTPRLVPEIGYCEYKCTLCGQVCPTQAIPQLPLEKKQKARLGTAKVDHALCLVWGHQTNCLVCEEHCPVADKAIKVVTDQYERTTLLKPVVDEKLCIGCGICQNKCPVRPIRAIKVEPS